MEDFSKIVVTLGGKRVGYVLDLAVDFYDMKKLGYYVVDEESEAEFLLRDEDVVSRSDEYVLIENESVLEFVTERETLFGKTVLDAQCQNYGRLVDIVFKKTKCEKFVTNKCEIATKFVEKVGQDFIIVNFHRKKKNLFEEKIFPNLQGEEIVRIQSAPIVTMPERVSLSSAFYIGKISSEDILGYNNEKIIQKGEIVTRSVVEKAKKHNKLNHLFFAIKNK